MVVMADLCLDEYTDHGHCGVLTAAGDGRQRRHPRAATAGWPWPRPTAGADVVAPERDDGRPGRRHPRPRSTAPGFDDDRDPRLRGQVRVGAVRPVPRRGRRDASSAAATARATSRTSATAARRSPRSALDVAEGADMVMVKPALAYLDVIAAVRGRGRRARRRLPRERRVRDAQGGGRAGLDRRRRGRATSTSPPSSGPAPT